jgi:hypothetical protein
LWPCIFFFFEFQKNHFPSLSSFFSQKKGRKTRWLKKYIFWERDQKRLFWENHIQKDYTLSFSNCFVEVVFLDMNEKKFFGTKSTLFGLGATKALFWHHKKLFF